MNELVTNTRSDTKYRASSKVAEDRGVDPITIYRWAKRGWIETINIAGRSYVDLESLARFDARAARGEFAKLTGAAAASQAREGKLKN